MSEASRPRSLTPYICGLIIIGLLAALPFVLPPDGLERASIAQFFGRLHPAIVHLPIGLLVLVPLFEVLGLISLWPHLQKSAGFVLGLATIGSLFATLAGWLLAWSGGYQGETVINHLWGGIATSSACLVLVAFRQVYKMREGFVLVRLNYIPLLLASVGAMAWTSHQGSIITHGEDYLTKHMPAGLRKFLGVPLAPHPSAKSGGTSFFTTKIAPILEKNCVPCHKPSKHKANLRMDAYALLMAGGDSGPPIVAGSLEKSDLYRRINLPTDDEDFMPNDGKPALSAADIKLIADWITVGAQP
ncbi:MAG: c-type cytochrome domain-containing protein [Opitutaceae bacterium]